MALTEVIPIGSLVRSFATVGNVTKVRLVHSKNAPYKRTTMRPVCVSRTCMRQPCFPIRRCYAHTRPMIFTLFGIVTEIKLVQWWNASY